MKPKLHTELIQQVLRHIDENRESWNQYHFVGGSPIKPTMCFGGRAYAIGTGETITNAGGLIVGNSRPIIETAQELLGFTDRQASRIFFFIRRRDRANPGMWVHVGFEDLVERVFKETGYQYEPGQEDASA